MVRWIFARTSGKPIYTAWNPLGFQKWMFQSASCFLIRRSWHQHISAQWLTPVTWFMWSKATPRTWALSLAACSYECLLLRSCSLLQCLWSVALNAARECPCQFCSGSACCFSHSMFVSSFCLRTALLSCFFAPCIEVHEPCFLILLNVVAWFLRTVKVATQVASRT